LSIATGKTAPKKGSIKDSASGSQRVAPKSNSNSAKKGQGSTKTTKKGKMETNLDKFIGDAQSEKVVVKPTLVSKETVLSNSSFKVNKKKRTTINIEDEESFVEREAT
jgi:hypothetical protein